MNRGPADPGGSAADSNASDAPTPASDRGESGPDGGGELRIPAAMRAVDHATLWVERPIRRLAGSARLNPLPHAGTISVFLLGLVTVTGLYITLFFEFGHEASYNSVAAMDDHAIQRVARALHRYASAALVLTTVVHAWRIFAAGRFTARLRRWRWATGVAALLLIWLAGVTGYWLIWDIRAQALNEIVLGFLGSLGFGAGAAVDHLGVVGDRSGSGFLLLIWFAHLLLTVLAGWFAFRHLRRANLPWLPPPHWMALMGVPLLLASLAFPVGMLPAADPGALIGEIPLDPFVLFLLPPLLSSWRWVTLIATSVATLVLFLLPRLIRRRDPAVVAIVDEACTGCELCVADCPYQALHMIDRSTGRVTEAPKRRAAVGLAAQDLAAEADRAAEPADGRNLLAVVEPDRCVGCGVCLGSCAFGAIALPGAEAPPPLDVDGRALVIACDRHLDQLTEDALGDGATVYPVRCAGALAPNAIRTFAERGATDIQLIGCAPSDCRYGIGNTLAAERLEGERRPHPPSRYARRVARDWVATDRVVGAMSRPGEHPSLDTRRPPARRDSLVGVALIAAVTALGVVFATRAPFGSRTDDTALRLVVDHEAGGTLRQDPEGGPVGTIERIELRLPGPDGGGDGAGGDGQTLTVEAPGGDRWVDVVDLGGAGLRPGSEARLQVLVHTGEGSNTLVDETIEPVGGRRIVVDVTDRPPAPGIDEGRRIFTSRDGGCSVCHSVARGDDGVGPSLYGIGSIAGSRVEGFDAEGYLRQSILLPDQYIVDGYPAGQMLPIYRERFTEDELDAVIIYLLSLTDPELEEGSDG